MKNKQKLAIAGIWGSFHNSFVGTALLWLYIARAMWIYTAGRAALKKEGTHDSRKVS
jgi:hypothetical protein